MCCVTFPLPLHDIFTLGIFANHSALSLMDADIQRSERLEEEEEEELGEVEVRNKRFGVNCRPDTPELPPPNDLMVLGASPSLLHPIALPQSARWYGCLHLMMCGSSWWENSWG